MTSIVRVFKAKEIKSIQVKRTKKESLLNLIKRGNAHA